MEKLNDIKMGLYYSKDETGIKKTKLYKEIKKQICFNPTFNIFKRPKISSCMSDLNIKKDTIERFYVEPIKYDIFDEHDDKFIFSYIEIYFGIMLSLNLNKDIIELIVEYNEITDEWIRYNKVLYSKKKDIGIYKLINYYSQKCHNTPNSKTKCDKLKSFMLVGNKKLPDNYWDINESMKDTLNFFIKNKLNCKPGNMYFFFDHKSNLGNFDEIKETDYNKNLKECADFESLIFNYTVSNKDPVFLNNNAYFQWKINSPLARNYFLSAIFMVFYNDDTITELIKREKNITEFMSILKTNKINTNSLYNYACFYYERANQIIIKYKLQTRAIIDEDIRSILSVLSDNTLHYIEHPNSPDKDSDEFKIGTVNLYLTHAYEYYLFGAFRKNKFCIGAINRYLRGKNKEELDYTFFNKSLNYITLRKLILMDFG